MKQPGECSSISEVRNEIDRIDKSIIALLGERFQFVKQIVNYKTTADDVLARQRYEEVLAERRRWAQDQGLNADVVEKMYIDLMQYFIDEQMQRLPKK